MLWQASAHHHSWQELTPGGESQTWRPRDNRTEATQSGPAQYFCTLCTVWEVSGWNSQGVWDRASDVHSQGDTVLLPAWTHTHKSTPSAIHHLGIERPSSWLLKCLVPSKKRLRQNPKVTEIRLGLDYLRVDVLLNDGWPMLFMHHNQRAEFTNHDQF